MVFIRGDKKKEFLEEFFKLRVEHQERALWIGCATKEQCEEGFREMFRFNKELIELGKKYGIIKDE